MIYVPLVGLPQPSLPLPLFFWLAFIACETTPSESRTQRARYIHTQTHTDSESIRALYHFIHFKKTVRKEKVRKERQRRFFPFHTHMCELESMASNVYRITKILVEWNALYCCVVLTMTMVVMVVWERQRSIFGLVCFTLFIHRSFELNSHIDTPTMLNGQKKCVSKSRLTAKFPNA